MAYPLDTMIKFLLTLVIKFWFGWIWLLGVILFVPRFIYIILFMGPWRYSAVLVKDVVERLEKALNK